MLTTDIIQHSVSTIGLHGAGRVVFCLSPSKKTTTPLPSIGYTQSISKDFPRCYFTGKERDEETGYGYFGARYMDHELMTMWLSVDPMADKYPSISPYAYCAWNPVKLVDPDGREIDEYRLNTETGSLVLTKKTKDNFDIIIPDNENIEPKFVSKGILNGKRVGDDVSKTGFNTAAGKQADGIAVMVYICCIY